MANSRTLKKVINYYHCVSETQVSETRVSETQVSKTRVSEIYLAETRVSETQVSETRVSETQDSETLSVYLKLKVCSRNSSL